MFDAVIDAVRDSVKTETIQVRDKEYTTREVFLPPKEITVGYFKVHSLSGIVDYLNQKIDSHDPSKLLVHILNESTVEVYEQVENKFNTRQLWIRAEADLKEFHFGQYFTQEDFIAAFQSLFLPAGDYEQVLKYVSNIVADEQIGHSDDGVSQEITTLSGINRKTEKIKNPVELVPIRTFTEIDQPGSPFVLRMSKSSGTVKTALFEADNGRWKNIARQVIKEYLKANLKVDVPILA